MKERKKKRKKERRKERKNRKKDYVYVCVCVYKEANKE